MKRAGYLYYLASDFTSAEQLFLECVDEVQKTTTNQTNHFAAYRDLLLLYSHFDLVKANELADKIVNIFPSSSHSKDLPIILANLYFF